MRYVGKVNRQFLENKIHNCFLEQGGAGISHTANNHRLDGTASTAKSWD